MKAIFLADLHLRSRPPSSRRDDFESAILNKLQWCLTFASNEECDAIFILGDIFHFKDPSRTPYRLTLRLINMLNDSNIPIYVLFGNHDLQSSGMASLPSQPSALLIASRAVTHSSEIVFDGVTVSMVDWIGEFSRELIPEPTPNLLNVLCGHWGMNPTGIYGNAPFEDLIGLGYDLVVYGHMHEKWGPAVVGDTLVVCLPALARGAIPTDELKCTPQVLYLNTDTGFTWVDVPHAPAADVFMYEIHEANKMRKSSVDAFIAAVGSLNVVPLSINEALIAIQPIVAPDVWTLLNHYLQEAS